MFKDLLLVMINKSEYDTHTIDILLKEIIDKLFVTLLNLMF